MNNKLVDFKSTKVIELGSCAFRQPAAKSRCRFVHGYRLVTKITFACKELDENNWCVDFGSLKALKELLESTFDHTLCVATDDPLIDKFQELHELGGCDLREFANGVGIEKFAEFILFTADEFIKKITHHRCSVEKVELWEHEKNSAVVTLEQSKNSVKIN